MARLLRLRPLSRAPVELSFRRRQGRPRLGRGLRLAQIRISDKFARRCRDRAAPCLRPRNPSSAS
jgi:hypothetical protein